MHKHTSVLAMTRAGLSGVLLVLAGCGSPTTHSGIAIRFSADRDTVAAGDSFEVVLVLRNVSPAPQRIRSGYGCLTFLETFRGDERVMLDGASYFCTAAITEFVLTPGDSAGFGAWLHASVSTRDSTMPASRGLWRVRTRMNVPYPDLEDTVTVVDVAPPNTRMDATSATWWGDMSALGIQNFEVSGVAGEFSLARHARSR